MNFLIPNYPQALFKLGANAPVAKYFAERVLTEIGYGTTLQKHDYQRLRWYPHLVGHACRSTDYERIRHLVVESLSDNRARLVALASNFDALASHLEPLLLRAPEYTYRLLQFYRLNSDTVKPRSSPDVYYQALAEDPNYLALFCGDKELDKLVPQARERRWDSAAWAYFYLEHTPGASISEDLVKILRGREEYAFRGAVLLSECEDSALEPMIQTLMERIKQPRYLYSSLMVPQLERWHEAFEERLIPHGPWLVEYVEKSAMQTARFHQLFRQAENHFAKHECRMELSVWSRFKIGTLTSPHLRGQSPIAEEA